ncbi:MAG: helix-turn-helix domain-containing protein [Paracoccaceae bacterium]
MVDTPRITELRGYDSYEVRLGDELRGERATLGKSLLDVQRELRIKASYIAAIEECDYSVFPNRSFVAGYVRSYARYLGLDSDGIYRRFCEESNFVGVNAAYAPAKRDDGKTVAPIGPVRLERDDPLLSKRMKGAAVPGGVLNRMSLAGIGSVMVLVVLAGGLGFAGWKMVQSIQRVELSPVDQSPILVSEVTVPGAPEGGSSGSGMDTNREAALVDRLIRPQTLPKPIFEPLDGPIVNIDPEKEGLVLPPVPEIVPADPVPEETEVTAVEEIDEPQVTERVTTPRVRIYASNAAWVRVYFADGSVLFEKILEKGESYELPEDVEAPLLRAGNSGSVFILVDRKVYGPVGTGTRVAKKVSLAAPDVTGSYPVADIPEAVPPAPVAENTAGGQAGN